MSHVAETAVLCEGAYLYNVTVALALCLKEQNSSVTLVIATLCELKGN